MSESYAFGIFDDILVECGLELVNQSLVINLGFTGMCAFPAWSAVTA